MRRHLSAIEGGRLAAACHPARLLTLLISDVPGDLPVDIASGPTAADPTTCADALAIVHRHGIELPAAVRKVLDSGRGESVKPGDPRLAGHELRLIATPQRALEAAAAVAREAGLQAHILGDAIEGEARDVGQVLAAIALQVADRGQPSAPPCVLLSGGETTVTVRGKGRGGRNVEFLLALGVALDGHPRIHAIERGGASVAPAPDPVPISPRSAPSPLLRGRPATASRSRVPGFRCNAPAGRRTSRETQRRRASARAGRTSASRWR